MSTNATKADESEGNSERETKIVRHIPIDVPIPAHVMDAAEKKNDEVPAGILEDYLIESISVSVRLLDS